MNSVLCNQGPMALINYMSTHLKQTKPDITLLSEEKIEIMVHKEIFYQTQLMRTMIRSTDSDYCCSNVSVICSIPREELEMMVQFLYSGEVYCKNQKEANILSENLTGLFGFPKIHSSSNLIEPKFEIASKSISKEEFFNMTNSSNRKKSRKQSLTSASIRNEFIDDLVSIKTESKDLFNETNMNEENLSDPLDTNEKGEDAENDTICKVPCTICSMKFVTKQARAAHVSLKHSGTCNVCLKQFESKQHLEDHISTAHTLPDFRRRLRCVICDILFKRRNKDKSTLMKHMKSEHKVGYECPICQKKLPTTSKLKQHKIQEHNMNKSNSVSKIKYLCCKCGKEFKQRLDYESHVSKMSCKAWRGKICSICDEKFETMSLRNDHITTKHKDVKLYDCSECSSQFLTEKNLKSHISNSHKPKVGSICPICGKILKTATALKKHISQVHEGNKPRFKCTLCDGSFSTKQALENHMSVHEGKIFHCSNCDEEFNSKNKLESHIAKEHDRSKLHKCEHCDSAYVTKNALVSHIAFVHDKTISNVCQYCGKNCMSKADLKNHIRIVHELAGKHLFKCEHCEKSFKLETGLKSHIKIIHEGTRVKCQVCQKLFVSKTARKRHIDNVHEKKKPYVCDICNESFAQSGHLVTHKKGKHKIAM